MTPVRRHYSLLLLLCCLVLVAPATAQVEVTVEPTMVAGPSNAPVTIVEFSDYQ